MIDVYIRTSDEAEGRFLCEWPADELGRLLPELGSWGIYCSAGEYETKDLSGQIRFDEIDAYFEVIVLLDDE